MLVLTACTATPTSPAASALGPLKIGILVPFTESAIDSDVGASQRRAADLYLKLKGGMLAGREIRLVYNDESALDPSVNKTRIQQFLLQDHVDLLLGGVGAPAAYLLRDTAEASKLLYDDTNAPANALTRAPAGCTPSCKSPFVFRSAPSSWQLSEPLGEWESKNGRKDYFVVTADDAFGTESGSAFIEGLAKNGGKPSGRTTVPAKSGADWAKVMAAVKAQPSKNVFAAFITDDAEGFLGAWQTAGMSAAGYGLAGPGPLTDQQVLAATKLSAIGVTTSFPWSSELDNAENKTFNDEFKKAYKDDTTGQPLAPDGYAALMWTAMRALETALTTTKGATRDTAALIAALEKASFSGPGGTVTFDPATHGAAQNIYIREVRASGGVLVNAVVDTIASVKDPAQ
ncbi:MAG TPA: ABC transporter substrate-binding protein [Patescibacteria group bacterium]|nr:ABC transporter substrate-binding protein [Patescibacteria group bacterium]